MDDAVRLRAYELAVKSLDQELGETMTEGDRTASRVFEIDDRMKRLEIERAEVLSRNKEAGQKILDLQKEKEEFEEAIELVKERMNLAEV
jgi:predicted nuclease with TOPRIM domain